MNDGSMTLRARWRCWLRLGHDWWSVMPLTGHRIQTPQWVCGEPPTRATCSRCGRVKATNYRTGYR